MVAMLDAAVLALRRSNRRWRDGDGAEEREFFFFFESWRKGI
jgi:hypothetical protein